MPAVHRSNSQDSSSFSGSAMSSAALEACFLPQFISEAQERSLIDEVSRPTARWKQVSGRQLQVHGGQVTDSGILITQPLPG